MTRRIVAYVIGAAIAALLVATVSSARLVGFRSVPAVALFAVLLGLLQSGVAPVLGRVPALAGCWPFTVATLLLNTGAFWLAGQVVPGMTVTPAGGLVGAVAAGVTAVAVFTLLDERVGDG